MPDGVIACWGHDATALAGPMSEAFQTVAAGARHTCGLGIDMRARCGAWADETGFIEPPIEPFDAITSGEQFSCTISALDHTATCWGWLLQGQLAPP
jgi:hypothetical protein